MSDSCTQSLLTNLVIGPVSINIVISALKLQKNIGGYFDRAKFAIPNPLLHDAVSNLTTCENCVDGVGDCQVIVPGSIFTPRKDLAVPRNDEIAHRNTTGDKPYASRTLQLLYSLTSHVLTISPNTVCFEGAKLSKAVNRDDLKCIFDHMWQGSCFLSNVVITDTCHAQPVCYMHSRNKMAYRREGDRYVRHRG